MQAVQRYDYVLERFGKNDANTDALGYQDFMGRAPGKVTPKSGLSIGADITSNAANNYTLIAVISAVAIMVVIGGYFFIRKRREDR